MSEKKVVVGLESKRAELPRTVLISVHGKSWVGNPEYAEGFDEMSGKPTGDMLCIAISNAYEVAQIPTPGKDNEGNMVINISFSLIKVGKIAEVPEEAVLIELSNDSPYYEQYVSISANIKLVKPVVRH